MWRQMSGQTSIQEKTICVRGTTTNQINVPSTHIATGSLAHVYTTYQPQENKNIVVASIIQQPVSMTQIATGHAQKAPCRKPQRRTASQDMEAWVIMMEDAARHVPLRCHGRKLATTLMAFGLAGVAQRMATRRVIQSQDAARHVQLRCHGSINTGMLNQYMHTNIKEIDAQRMDIPKAIRSQDAARPAHASNKKIKKPVTCVVDVYTLEASARLAHVWRQNGGKRNMEKTPICVRGSQNQQTVASTYIASGRQADDDYHS